jgi:acetone carboxylase beta subunit
LQVALVASIETRKPEFPRLPDKGPTPPEAAYKGERDLYIDGEWQTGRIYDMDEMESGNIVDGLAVLEHPATTLLVPRNRRARMDEYKFVWLENI